MFSFEWYAGGPFLYWFGLQPRICILDYELVKQILVNKYGHFVKNDTHPTILAIIGKGLILVEGTNWVRHRRVVNPAFAMDKLKVMVYIISNSVPISSHGLAFFQKSTQLGQKRCCSYC